MSAGNGLPDDSFEQNALNYGSYPPVPILTTGTKSFATLVVNPEGRIVSVTTGTLPAATTAKAQGVTHGTAVGPGAAQAQPSVTITGVSSTSVAFWSLPNAPDATWQTGIAVELEVGSNAVTPYLVNPTLLTITPITQTLNLGVIF